MMRARWNGDDAANVTEDAEDAVPEVGMQIAVLWYEMVSRDGVGKAPEQRPR